MSRTPLVIAKDHAEIAPIAAAYDEQRDIAHAKLKELKEQAEVITNELSEHKKVFWEKTTAVLMAENKVENDDVPMAYSDGVIYKEDENDENRHPIAKLLGGLLLGDL